MDINATVQARNDSTESDRPTTQRISALANELQRRGFHVHHAGRFGVSVTADESRYKSALGIEPLKSQGTRHEVSEQSELAGLAEAVEIAPDPVLYGR